MKKSKPYIVRNPKILRLKTLILTSLVLFPMGNVYSQQNGAEALPASMRLDELLKNPHVRSTESLVKICKHHDDSRLPELCGQAIFKKYQSAFYANAKLHEQKHLGWLIKRTKTNKSDPGKFFDELARQAFYKSGISEFELQRRVSTGRKWLTQLPVNRPSGKVILPIIFELSRYDFEKNRYTVRVTQTDQRIAMQVGMRHDPLAPEQKNYHRLDALRLPYSFVVDGKLVHKSEMFFPLPLADAERVKKSVAENPAYKRYFFCLIEGDCVGYVVDPQVRIEAAVNVTGVSFWHFDLKTFALKKVASAAAKDVLQERSMAGSFKKKLVTWAEEDGQKPVE